MRTKLTTKDKIIRVAGLMAGSLIIAQQINLVWTAVGIFTIAFVILPEKE